LQTVSRFRVQVRFCTVVQSVLVLGEQTCCILLLQTRLFTERQTRSFVVVQWFLVCGVQTRCIFVEQTGLFTGWQTRRFSFLHSLNSPVPRHTV